MTNTTVEEVEIDVAREIATATEPDLRTDGETEAATRIATADDETTQGTEAAAVRLVPLVVTTEVAGLRLLIAAKLLQTTFVY